MKILGTILALLTCIQLAFAPPFMGVAMQNKVVATGGGTVFLVNENFETGTVPSGWSAGGTANFNYTAAPLAGSVSLLLTATSDYAFYDFGATYPELHGEFLYRRPSALPLSFTTILDVYDNAFSTVFTITLLSTGQLVIGGGNVFQMTVSQMSADTTYYIWWRYKKGSGANSEAEVWFSTSSTRPGTGNFNAVQTNGNLTTDVNYFRFDSDVSTGTGIFDNAQISQTDF